MLVLTDPPTLPRMHSSKKWIIPTAISASVAVLGWMFIGFDKSRQRDEMENDGIAAFEQQLSPVEGPEGPSQEDVWSPIETSERSRRQLDSALRLLERPGRRQDGIAALEKLAARGFHDAMFELGKAYMDERFSSVSQDRAYAWLTVAQAFGSPDAGGAREALATKMDQATLTTAHERAGDLLGKLKKRIGGKDE